MWAIMNTPDTLNNMPLWMLDAFCKEWRVSVTIENGKITEINNDQEESTMNELSIETLIALHEAANICIELAAGKITRMFIEGGNENE